MYTEPIVIPDLRNNRSLDYRYSRRGKEGELHEEGITWITSERINDASFVSQSFAAVRSRSTALKV